MTQSDKLTIEEIQELITLGVFYGGTERQVLQQLADTMRENERLRGAANGVLVSFDDLPLHIRMVLENILCKQSKVDGCQMPKIAIDGYCAICGSANRSCQPEKQPTKT